MEFDEGLGLISAFSSTRLHQSAIVDADDPMSLFTSILKNIAEEIIPKTLAVPKGFSRFIDTCKEATKERNRVLEKIQRILPIIVLLC